MNSVAGELVPDDRGRAVEQGRLEFITLDDIAFIQDRLSLFFNGDDNKNKLRETQVLFPLPRATVLSFPPMPEPKPGRAPEYTELEGTRYFIDDPGYFKRVREARLADYPSWLTTSQAAEVSLRQRSIRYLRRLGNITVGTLIALAPAYAIADAAYIPDPPAYDFDGLTVFGASGILAYAIFKVSHGRANQRWEELMSRRTELSANAYFDAELKNPEPTMLSIDNRPIRIEKLKRDRVDWLAKYIYVSRRSWASDADGEITYRLQDADIKPGSLVQHAMRDDGKPEELWATYLAEAARELSEAANAIQATDAEIVALAGRNEHFGVPVPGEREVLDKQREQRLETFTAQVFRIAAIAADRRNEQHLERIQAKYFEQPKQHTDHPLFEVILGLNDGVFQLAKPLPKDTAEEIGFIEKMFEYVNRTPEHLKGEAHIDQFYSGFCQRFGEQIEQVTGQPLPTKQEFYDTYIRPRVSHA